MKTAPKVLTKGIVQFLAPPGDPFEEQPHEREELGKGGTPILNNDLPPDQKAKRDAFFEKHSARRNAPPELGGDVKNKPNQEQVDQVKKEAEAKAEREAAEREHSEKVAAEAKEKKGPGANVPHIIEQKRAAEKQRDEYKTKLDEYETKIKPELDKKIADLQSKIESGDFSSKKEKEFQERIDNLEREKKEKEDSLVNENKKLRDQVAFYDIQSTPEFQQQYIQPVLRCHQGMVKSLNGNKRALGLLQQALTANQFAIDAQSDEERQQAVAARGEAYSAALNEINDEVLREDFKGFFRDYLRHAEAHSQALADHQQTKEKITKEARTRAEKAYADQLDTWGRAYDAMGVSYKDDEVLSQAELDIAKDLELDPISELKHNNLVASKVVVGQTSMEEALRIVHEGRVSPVLRAKIAILEQQVKDRDAVIQKLRGAGTGGGGGGGGDKPKGGTPAPGEPPQKPRTREEFHRQFQPK